ncbi:myocardin-related transcription factor A-like isoform 2-T2 [Menidia menidia]
MLDHLQCVRINPAPFRPQPISSSMDERDIRFELERRACQSLRKVLQLKLQQRKTREELLSKGIMPALKTSAAFNEQRQSLDPAKTGDYLKRKIRSQPEIRMHVLGDASTGPTLQAKQLQLKRARLADDLNNKIAHRPGPMELIQKNILPVHSRIKEAIIETQFPKVSGENSSCDEDSNDSLSPGQPIGLDYPLDDPGAVPSPTEILAGSSIPSPSQALPPTLHFQPISRSLSALKLTNRTVQRTGANADIKSQPKPNCDRISQKPKKSKDNKPKIKKLKYHQYIPPDQKGDKEPPPHLDSSYAKVLQQQQLFLQLQILSQQQQQFNYHTILPAPSKDKKPSSSSSDSTSISSPPRPAAAPSPGPADQLHYICLSSALSGGTKASAHPNLDGMKVAELKSELKLRSLPVSGTKNDLIERLKTYQELNRGGNTTSSPTAGGTTGSGHEGGGGSSKTAGSALGGFQHQKASSLSANAGRGFSPAEAGNNNPKPGTPAAPGPKHISFNGNLLEELIVPPVIKANLHPSSVAVRIKEEPTCSTQAPCQFSLKSAPLQRQCRASSAAPTPKTAASPVTVDKDRMLQEKDKQIAELLRRLRQKQRLVESLKMQLELGNREADGAQEPPVPVRVKEEPPDHPAPPTQGSPGGQGVAKLAIKQEAVETEIGGAEPPVGSPLPQSRGLAEAACLQLRPVQKGVQQKQEQAYVHQLALRLAQQQAMQTLLQKQRGGVQAAEPQPKINQQRHRKGQKPQPRQPEQQQAPPRQQQPPQRPCQQPHMKQQHQIQRRAPSPWKREAQQLPPHIRMVPVSQTDHKQTLTTSHSTPPLPVKIPKSGLRAERADASEGTATSHIALQRLHSTPSKLPSLYPVQVTGADSGSKQHVGVLKRLNSKNEALVEPQQGAALCLSAPPGLQPFFRDQGSAPTRRNTSSTPTQTEMCADLEALLSPLSPASASQASDRDAENQDDFIDIILQAGGMSTFSPALDPSQDHLNPISFVSSPPPSPPYLLLPSPITPGGSLPQSSGCPQPDPCPQVTTPGNKHHLSLSTNGRLEDFLESTTGKPLLGVEPGGLITLIDDLHSQLLCTPSILDHPPSPIDTFGIVGEGGQGLDNSDWLDLTIGERDEETPMLDPLGSQTPHSVFSTDFLDSSDLHTHWGSCL